MPVSSVERCSMSPRVNCDHRKPQWCSLVCVGMSRRGKPGPSRGKPSPLRKGQESPCEQCGKMIWVSPYARKKGYGRFCSKHCFGQSLITGKVLNCLECAADIWAVPARAERTKYCSKECYSKRARAIALRAATFRQCVVCKQEFIVRRNGQQYCSAECSHAS